MPRTSRAIAAGYCYHVINRGNNKAARFHTRSDYAEFLRLAARASERFSLPLIGACVMPNHVHLMVKPAHGRDLSRWVHWLFLTYSRRYHKKYGTTGRLWENRYKAFPIQGDSHFLIVLRYVERNALRANLVARAEDWEWGSLRWRLGGSPFALGDSPVALPPDWMRLVNSPQTEEELAAVRNAVNRQSPFGEPDWTVRTAADLGLQQSVAPRGRPKRTHQGK